MKQRLSPVVLASTPLQVLLYYNIYLWIAWIAILLPAVILRIIGSGKQTLDVSDVFSLTAVAAFGLIEPLRIYLGYKGNLHERVPHASACALITVFPQIPLWAYQISTFSASSFAIGVAVSIPIPFFLVFEFTFSIILIRRLVNAQQAAFWFSQQQEQNNSNSEEEKLNAPTNEEEGEEEGESHEQKPSDQPSEAWIPLEKRNKKNQLKNE